MIKTSLRNQAACGLALANFATAKWPHRMAGLMFLVGLRTKLATIATRIEIVADLVRELPTSCAFETSVLGKHADELLSIIKSIISPTQLGADASDLDVQSHAVEPLQSHVKHHVEEIEAMQSC